LTDFVDLNCGPQLLESNQDCLIQERNLPQPLGTREKLPPRLRGELLDPHVDHRVCFVFSVFSFFLSSKIFVSSFKRTKKKTKTRRHKAVGETKTQITRQWGPNGEAAKGEKYYGWQRFPN